jgi:hypothetical protein
LFDLESDPQQEHNLAGTARERDYAARLADALRSAHAPPEQYVRLGL